MGSLALGVSAQRGPLAPGAPQRVAPELAARMSLTVAVFDPSAAPAERAAFLAWYADAVVSTALPTAGLEAWKRQMKDAYRAGEIFGGTSVVVATFPESDAEDAHTSGFALAGKHA